MLGAEDLAHVLVPLLKVSRLKTYQGRRLGHLGGRLGLILYYMASGSLVFDLTQLLELAADVCMVKVSS